MIEWEGFTGYYMLMEDWFESIGSNSDYKSLSIGKLC